MSHVAVVEMKIKNLDILEKVCKKLKLEFKRGQKSYRWFQRFTS
jgi:hypothetical protein